MDSAKTPNRLLVESPKRNTERGQALILVTLGITLLFAVLGLVVDVGYGYYLKQVAQGAADAAAMAGATNAKTTGSYCGHDGCQTGYTCPTESTTSTTNLAVACLYAKNNGGQNVTLSEGTGLSPSGANTTYWITANVSQQLPLGFLATMGFSGGTASSQGTGAVIKGAGGGGCIYVLNPTLGQSMTVSGGSSFIQSDCGVYVDSNASNALNVSGGAKVTAGVVNVVGGTSITGGSTVTPTAHSNAPVAADPLASLPAPTFSGCDKNSYSFNGGTTTLNPGVYCGGIRITGTSNVTFNPGTYILNGGGISISGGNTTVTGNGVFFYNTSSGYNYGPVLLQGGTSTTLTAPTSGTYQGILFFNDRAVHSSTQNTISGGSTGNLSGSIYMPTGALVFSGGSTSGPLTLAIIVDSFTVSGASYLKQDTSGNLTGLGSSLIALVQ